MPEALIAVPELLAAAGADVAAAGIGTAAIDTAAIEGAAIGGGLGGITSAAEGKNIGTGILGGALGGAVTGGMGSFLDAGILGGVASGALGGLVSGEVEGGKNLGASALEGGVAGGALSALGGAGLTSNAPTGGTSAGALSAPASAPAPTDATQGGTYGFNTGGTGATSTAASSGFTSNTGLVSPGLPSTGLPGTAGFSTSGEGLSGAPTASSGLTSLADAGGPRVGPTIAGAPGATGDQSLVSQLVSGVKENPKVALGVLGLGASALEGQQKPKGYNQTLSEANSLAAQGTQLQNSLNGAIPPAAQAALNQASQSVKAQVRSTYANLGLAGSTMEASALASVDQSVAAQGYQMVQQLYQQGVSESSMAAGLFQSIMKTNQEQTAGLSSAVANFAGALAGGQPSKSGA